jgi:hypothetical protein
MSYLGSKNDRIEPGTGRNVFRRALPMRSLLQGHNRFNSMHFELQNQALVAMKVLYITHGLAKDNRELKIWGIDNNCFQASRPFAETSG